jgi:hypothetical protein
MTDPSEQRDPAHRIPAWLWACWGFSLLLTLGLAFDVSPWLRGDLDWRWAYAPVVAPLRIGLVAAIFASYIGGSAWLWQRARAGSDPRWTRIAISFAVLAGIGLQIAIQLVADPNPLRELLWRTVSPEASGYYNAALYIQNPSDWLRHFPELARGYRPHPQRHPPGQILIFIGAQKFLGLFPGLSARLAGALHLYRCEYWPLLYTTDVQTASMLVGLVTIPLNLLALIPLYGAGRRILRPRSALAAVLISPLIPGYLLWGGIWDQVLVLIAALTLYWLIQALVDKMLRAWVFAGLTLSVGSFLNHSTLTLVVFAGIFSLLFVWHERSYWQAHRRSLAAGLALFGAGLVSIWVVYWIGWGVTFWDVWQANTTPHFGMTTHYFLRLFYNPYDFTLFLGFPLGIAALVALIRSLYGGRDKSSHVQSLYLLAFGLTMTALVVSGISRAEVGRVWVLLMPLATLAAFALYDAFDTSLRHFILTAGLLGLQALVMQVTFFSDRPTLHVYQPNQSQRPVGAQIGNSITLLSYDIERADVQPGDDFVLQISWQAEDVQADNYIVFIHLYNPDLGLAGQLDTSPRDGQYPTSCWLTGEVIEDSLVIPIKPDAQPGTYDLLVGMYTFPDIVRLPVRAPQARDNAVILDRINVNEP